MEELRRFLDLFELVFGDDWEHSKGCLRDDSIGEFVAEEGTFLNPNIEDESNNWGNRGALLHAYREAKAAMLLLDAEPGTEMPV